MGVEYRFPVKNERINKLKDCRWMRYLLQVYRLGQACEDDRIIFAWVETVGKNLKQERSYHQLRPRQEFPKLFALHQYSHVTLQLSVFVDGDVLNNHVTLFYFACEWKVLMMNRKWMVVLVMTIHFLFTFYVAYNYDFDRGYKN